MAEVRINGVMIAYQQMGAGPDLVFVHGLAASRAFWFLQYAVPLSKFFRVTLFDLRGHGYSSMPPSGYDTTTVAGDLLGLLDQLGIESCALVFAGLHPRRVNKLAIFESKINALQPIQRLSDSPRLSPFEIQVAAKSGHDWENEPQVGLKFLDVLARRKANGGGTDTKDSFTPFGEGRGAIRTAAQFVALLDQTTAAAEVSLPGIRHEAIAALPMPILWVYGEWSRCLPSCRILQTLRPASEFQIVAEGGHFLPIINAGLVTGWLSSFLEATPPAR
jgi:pimeloyl-ACP methyl ester carboxylesterase